MQTGLITDIQRFSVDDGPGIRTTVFLKGCPLRCLWCHNPETQSTEVELRCVGSECESWGKTVTVEEVVGEVMKDKRYYDTSGGGLTISGGEPLLQAKFTLALLAQAKAVGLHTCLETCGYVEEKALREAAAWTDIFLYDYKATDPAIHQELTGVSNRRILRNLDMLYNLGASIILRCPIIPGCNMEAAHFDGIIALLEKYPNIPRAELMAYHKMGASKYKQLGKPYTLSHLPDMSPEQKAETLEYFHAHTKRPVLFG